MRGRETGTAGNRHARDFLVDRLREAGVPPLGTAYEHPFFWVQQDGVKRHGVNVLAQVRGRIAPGRALVLSAHYDHLGTEGAGERADDFSGADDNASGVAAVLEVARALVRQPPACSVVVALFDGEEAELRGSRAFVLHPPLDLAQVAVNVNVDMIGRSRDGALWAVGTRHYPMLREPLERVAADARVPMRFGHDRFGWVPGLDHDWTAESDHESFHLAGVPFVYLGTANDPETHATSDTADTVDEAFFGGALQAVGEVVTTLDRWFANR